jgi:hypothetical protein
MFNKEWLEFFLITKARNLESTKLILLVFRVFALSCFRDWLFRLDSPPAGVLASYQPVQSDQDLNFSG